MRLLTLLFLLLLSTSMFAQYEADRHSTNHFDAWISCEKSLSPNETWGERHWIMYEFENVYVLGQMTYWNYNDREYNEIGIRDVIIDYSIDGDNWTQLGIYEFEKAPNSSFYQGIEGPDLDGIEAKYILLTVLSNHGGGSCTGLGEIKIETTGYPSSTHTTRENLEFTLSPNPAIEQTQLSITLKDLAPIDIDIIDESGRKLKSWKESPSSLSYSINIPTQNLLIGSYFIYLKQDNKVSIEKLTVVK